MGDIQFRNPHAPAPPPAPGDRMTSGNVDRYNNDRYGAWNSLFSGNPARPFKSNSLPGTTPTNQRSPFSPHNNTQLADRHRNQFGYTGKTVSEPMDEQSVDATWHEHYPGRPRHLPRTPSTDLDDSWPRGYNYSSGNKQYHHQDNMSYDSSSTLNFYHHRLYGGRDFIGAGIMTQSIDRSLNRSRLNSRQGSEASLFYDGRR